MREKALLHDEYDGGKYAAAKHVSQKNTADYKRYSMPNSGFRWKEENPTAQTNRI